MALTDNPWTPDELTTLRHLWADGHSTAEIGRRMGRSKNSVVGKVHRLLDLDGRPSPIQIAGAPPHVPRVGNKSTLEPLPAMAAIVDAEPAALATVFRGRKSSECCWPMWSLQEKPTQEFCCAPTIPGKSYCPEHRAKAWDGVVHRGVSTSTKSAGAMA